MTEQLVEIASIKVVDRHRRDLGDIDGLMKSIMEISLINPITLTPDLRLVAGGRRLEAYKRLGQGMIPARIVERLSDAADALRAEQDENTCRKDMLPSEKAALGEALHAIERPKAEQRNREALARGRTATSRGENGRYEPSPDVENLTDTRKKPVETRDCVGEALGMSGSTYGRLRSTYKLANDPTAPEAERKLAQEALERMDDGAGVAAESMRLRRQLQAKREAQEVKADVLEESTAQSEWIPTASERGPKPAARRRELIREWTEKAWTSHQIADKLGMAQRVIREIARKEGITIPADEVFGRSRQKVDSNRIVRVIVEDLASVDTSLNLVNFEELERSEIEDWTASLSKSIRVLNRLNKQLKEMVQ